MCTNRFDAYTVFSWLTTACRRAGCPTSNSPSTPSLIDLTADTKQLTFREGHDGWSRSSSFSVLQNFRCTSFEDTVEAMSLCKEV